MTALRIEIQRIEHNGLWRLRIGDIEGCTEMSNVNFTEVLDEIHDRMKEVETNQCVEGGSRNEN